MLKRAAVATFAFAAGLTAGWFAIQPTPSAPPLPPAGPAAATAAPEDLPAIQSEIASLEAVRAPKAAAPPDLKAKAAELCAKIPALRDAGDKEALYKLLQELAALGEPGFPGALEIALLLGNDEGSPLRLVDDDPRFPEVFTPGLLAFADWALRKRDGVPPWLARLSMRGLSRAYDRDPAPPFFAYLAHCGDSANAETAVNFLRGLEVPSLAPAIADAVRGQAKNARLAWELLEGLGRIKSPVALQHFEALAASSDPAVAALGARGLATVRPPPERAALTFNGDTTSFTQPYGLDWGDVVVSLDATTLTSVDHLKDLYAKAPDGTPQILTIERDGKLMRIRVTHYKGGGSIEPLLPSGKTAMEEWNEKQESER
ncbi:MAG: hypothetical protein AAB074_02160 [Planctomycetota bacterium]